jgi:predicted RNase H-like nuclease (RuvC/YqgF family)
LFHYMAFFGPLHWGGRGKDAAMSALSEPKRYRSPRHKLLAFFEKSRDGWKSKCLAAKKKAKALANNVAALRKSRERWKALAREHRSEVERLQQELEQAKSSPRQRSSSRRHLR